MAEPSRTSPEPGTTRPVRLPGRTRSRLVPVAAGLAGLILGLVVGAAAADVEPVAAAPEVVTEIVEVDRVVEVDPSDEREAELDVREARLDEREETITAARDERDAELDEREAALDEREAELDQVEAEIEAGSIPGDGVWAVGDEVEPGTYRAQGSGGSCYYARLSSFNTGDIITNHFGSASVTAEIHPGDVAFETSGCGSWRRL